MADEVASTSSRTCGKNSPHFESNVAYNCLIYGDHYVKALGSPALEKQTADLLAGAFFDVLEEIGLSTSAIFEAILETPLPAPSKELARASTRAAFAQKLRSLPEPSKEHREKALAMIASLKKTPQQMRPLLRKVAKELPRARSGPKKKLSAETEILACSEVDSRRTVYSDREAIQQVARKFKVSERTMYRIWERHRKELRKQQRERP